MIISASYRTDIPAFYGDWFLRRVAAGAARFRNPFGGAMVEVSLRPEHVDGIVFWTRNFGPLMDHLAPIQNRNWPFIIQYTLTGYPRILEPSVIDEETATAQVRALADKFGKRVVVWRYDPIVITDYTDEQWHRQTFGRLARCLQSCVDEVVVSFVEPYRKTRRNLNRMTAATGVVWRQLPDDKKLALLRNLAPIAAENGMTLTLCAQPGLVRAPRTRADSTERHNRPARCIDVYRLSDVAGRPITAKQKGNRPGCLCAQSRDIGVYDTCPHGCVYCYAVQDRERAKAAFSRHDPSSLTLAS
ncbi:MAG: DUF1848 domain-containing protein [Rhodospirillaceae bacterium]|nr:DUF1848 domain-containing protein [Rhodospirillaceae bacterium]MCY4238246.1 DUF1848 domain-containing protein [Rhodospirillaceae bacterium]MCY4310572.1 DUF1848 domain-containing protein [Rhodospirillaceae bacterium]